jgi:hypothetical protein
MAVGDEMNALGSGVLVDALDDPLNSAGAKVMAEAGIKLAVRSPVLMSSSIQLCTSALIMLASGSGGVCVMVLSSLKK